MSLLSAPFQYNFELFGFCSLDICWFNRGSCSCSSRQAWSRLNCGCWCWSRMSSGRSRITLLLSGTRLWFRCCLSYSTSMKKNFLIHDKSLIADCIAKDVCSIVLASEREMFPRSNCRCEELQYTCDREHSRVLELEVKITEKQQMLAKFENQNSLIQKQFVDLQVKFQNYKECLRNQKVCEQPNATASNAIFEINKLKAQLQEKDDTIRYLHAEKDIL
nr:hypothetical protein [Tanacetum cinerariifolium]